MPTPLKKVISGGQTGVDQAALRAAQTCGLECGGWCPPGRESESGVIPARFPLQETPQDRSPHAPDVPRSQRTEWNVRDSDATLILRPRSTDKDLGTDWTERCAPRFGRPLLVLDPGDPEAASAIRDWLSALEIQTLNIAGPSEGTAPGIGDQVYSLLAEVFG
ncbi:MAG TPA: putative molybdenum carrier protein [Thermoanaerobaculia bacterium]